jgi:hypothetical protein
MAFSEDGTAIAVTSLGADPSNSSVGDTSVLLSGFVPASDAGSNPSLGTNASPASMQFIADDMPLGGDGLAAVPHDLAAVPAMTAAAPLRPAWLQVSNAAAEIDLLRYYNDEGYADLSPLEDGGLLPDAGVAVEGSSNLRPFIVKERAYAIDVEANGNDSRSIAIDPTPRIACEQAALAAGAPVASAEYVSCAQTPARVFIASQSPDSLIVGQIGGVSPTGGAYDPDLLTLLDDVTLPAGPTNVYVAPIVDQSGKYSVRVFVVCFDSQIVAIYDPDTGRIENEVPTGPGPFAMAFDPFDVTAVATHAAVPFDPRAEYPIVAKGDPIDGKPSLRTYRFAYVGSFTDSYVQVLDLDQSFEDDRLTAPTFETMVYSLGVPIETVQTN